MDEMINILIFIGDNMINSFISILSNKIMDFKWPPSPSLPIEHKRIVSTIMDKRDRSGINHGEERIERTVIFVVSRNFHPQDQSPTFNEVASLEKVGCKISK